MKREKIQAGDYPEILRVLGGRLVVAAHEAKWWKEEAAWRARPHDEMVFTPDYTSSAQIIAARERRRVDSLKKAINKVTERAAR